MGSSSQVSGQDAVSLCGAGRPGWATSWAAGLLLPPCGAEEERWGPLSSSQPQRRTARPQQPGSWFAREAQS